jgi:hypothetical protein
MTADAGAEPTFDLDLYLSLPRAAGLAPAPDGGRLATSVATPGPREPRLFAAAPPPAGDGRMAPGRPELL